MKKIIFTVLLLIVTNCKAQIDNNLKDIDMKYFNENNFKDWEKDNSYIAFPTIQYLKKDNKRVKITTNDKSIQVELHSVNDPYTYFYLYDTKYEKIQVRGKKFHSMEIGIWEYYDIYGEIVKKIDMDKGVSFSLTDLVNKMKKEYDIDLSNMHRDKITMSKGMCGKYICYQISISTHSEYDKDIYKIDVVSGKTLFAPNVETKEITNKNKIRNMFFVEEEKDKGK